MEVTKVKIKDLTDFVISYFNNEGTKITPLKLQKILYYIQAWHLVFFDKNPFFDEQPEAWVNGPVYRSVYGRFKDVWFSESKLKIDESPDEEKNLNKYLDKLSITNEQKEFVSAVLRKYGVRSAEQLVYMTHIEEPWNKARNGIGPFERCSNKITFESMYEYYKQRTETK
jgi:uncharacterized phage-associated protein